jgi:hypothetical protein
MTMPNKATTSEWDAYYQRATRQHDIVGDVYHRERKRKEQWQRVIAVAFGAYIAAITVAFVALR